MKQDPIKVIVTSIEARKVSVEGVEGEPGQVVSAPGGLKPELWHTCSCWVSQPGRIKVFSSEMIQRAMLPCPLCTHNAAGRNRKKKRSFRSLWDFLFFFFLKVTSIYCERYYKRTSMVRIAAMGDWRSEKGLFLYACNYLRISVLIQNIKQFVEFFNFRKYLGVLQILCMMKCTFKHIIKTIAKIMYIH